MSAATIHERNAANAQHSTGPVTAEGKARSAQNALRHGLAGKTIILAHENQADYDALKAAFADQYQPVTDHERELLARLVDCRWRLNRALRVETEFLSQRIDAISEADPNLAGDAALAAMFNDPAQSRSYRLFLRYLTNAQNAYRQAKAELEKTRDQRLAREEQEAALAAMRAVTRTPGRAATSPTPANPPQSGFVSQPNYAAAADPAAFSTSSAYSAPSGESSCLK